MCVTFLLLLLLEYFFLSVVVVVVRRKEVEVERCGRRTKLRARASLSSVCVSNRRSDTEEGERERERERRRKGKREKTRTYTPEKALKCIGGALRPHTHARLEKDGSVAGDFTQGESVATGARRRKEENWEDRQGTKALPALSVSSAFLNKSHDSCDALVS